MIDSLQSKITAGFGSWIEAFERNPFQFTYAMMAAPEPRDRLIIVGRNQYAAYLSYLETYPAGTNWRRIKRERRKAIKRRLCQS